MTPAARRLQRIAVALRYEDMRRGMSVRETLENETRVTILSD